MKIQNLIKRNEYQVSLKENNGQYFVVIYKYYSSSFLIRSDSEFYILYAIMCYLYKNITVLDYLLIQ